MKIFRYSLFVAALLGMAGLMNSCNDDDSGNGAGDATIGFAKSTYTYKESAGLVKLPVAFTGEPKSYPITFNVSAEIAGTDVKLEEVAHFTQLEGLRYVGNEKAPAYIEFELFDNTEINEPRFITLTITSASGAVIENGTTTIEVADNDNNPYEKLWGNWTFTGNSISDGTPQTFDVNISGGFTEEDVAKNADKVLVCWGFAGYKETVATTPANQPVWYINYDADAGTLSIAVGAAAGALVAIPMIAQKSSFRSCLAAFCTYLFAGVVVFYSDLPYLPWWADGMGIALMMAIPSATIGSGKESRPVPTLINALLLGFLISVAERYLA